MTRREMPTCGGDDGSTGRAPKTSNRELCDRQQRSIDALSQGARNTLDEGALNTLLDAVGRAQLTTTEDEIRDAERGRGAAPGAPGEGVARGRHAPSTPTSGRQAEARGCSPAKNSTVIE